MNSLTSDAYNAETHSAASPIRVLEFSRGVYPDMVGGREIFVADLIAALRGRGHRVVVLSVSRLPRSENVERLPAVWIDIPVLRFLVFGASGFVTAVRRRKTFDLVHTHSPRLNVLLGHLIAKATGKPHVITVHCATTKDFLRDRGTAAAYWDAAALVAVSAAMATAIRDQIGALPQITVIPSGSRLPPISRSRDEVRADLGLGRKDAILIFLGRLDPHKQPHLILDALERLGTDYCTRHRLRVLFVGDGPELERLRSRVQGSVFESSVRFLGAVPHSATHNLLAASDIFVLPSKGEGLGIAVVEAMAASTPAIVSDAEGLRDLVKDGDTGLLFKSGDASALADAIRRVVDDPGLHRSLGARARNLAVTRFDFDRIVDQHEALYEAALRGAADRPRPQEGQNV